MRAFVFCGRSREETRRARASPKGGPLELGVGFLVFFAAMAYLVAGKWGVLIAIALLVTSTFGKLT